MKSEGCGSDARAHLGVAVLLRVETDRHLDGVRDRVRVRVRVRARFRS